MTRVSVVVPTLNGGDTLRLLLEAIDGQDGAFDVELIAVDSGSTDGTLDLLRKHGATIVAIPRGEFNHGVSRNEALERANGELAVLIVQDAVPADTEWLAELVRPLQLHPSVAGTFARQQPWPDASRITAHYAAGWAAAAQQPRTVGPLTRERLAAMNPVDRHRICAFDNVCASIRMAVWRRHPFRRTAIAEDLEWALEVLLAGHQLSYAPAARVWHSHDRTVVYELQRAYLVHQRLQLLFGLSTVPTVGALIRAVGTTVPLHARLAASEPRERARALVRAAGLAVAMPLGQYLGARSAREGRELLRTRGV
jgi:rhamnosyltransferase